MGTTIDSVDQVRSAVPVPEQLREIASRYHEELSTVRWASEADRLAELVFCVLDTFLDDPSRSRSLTYALQSLGLLDPACLASADDETSEFGAIGQYALLRYGFGAEEALRAAKALARIGAVIEREYGGKLQRYLRHKGELIRDELVEMFAASNRGEPDLRPALERWLRGALNLPLTAGGEEVRHFCREHGLSPRALENAADDIDLNVAVLSELLKAERSRR